MCTARLVPLTTLCATFLAVIAVFFATCLAVRAGPACTLPAQTANARITENNAFIVPNISLHTDEMRLSADKLSLQCGSRGRIRTYDQSVNPDRVGTLPLKLYLTGALELVVQISTI